MQRKLLFTGYSLNLGKVVTEEIELPAEYSDMQVQDAYEQWVWELIGDYFSWEEQ